jgi:hypothetical protein
MRLSSLCVVGFSFVSACARPSLDGEEVDGGAPPSTVDASRPLDSGPRMDASRDPVPDSGCKDKDKDGRCDADDNCPDDANPDQADANGDGMGDACSVEQVDCSGAQVEAAPFGNTAAFTMVSVNGQSGTQATVAPKSKVMVRFQLTYTDCGGSNFQQLSVGLEGDKLDCKSTECMVRLGFPVAVVVDAPEEPGLYYVLAGVRPSASATACSADAATSKPVIALCVKP